MTEEIMEPTIRCTVLIPQSGFPDFLKHLEGLRGRLLAGAEAKNVVKLTSSDITEIRRLFQMEGLTQVEIAERFGKSPSTIKEYLRGFKRPKPPKEEKPSRPPGRPRLSLSQKVARKDGDQLLKKYETLRRTYPPEVYRQLFATHEEVIMNAINVGDVDTLYWCFENQSWTKGGALKIPDVRKQESK